MNVMHQHDRPSVLFKPRLWWHDGGPDVDPWGREFGPLDACWCAQYGPDGLTATGSTQAKAMLRFDDLWNAPIGRPLVP